VGETSGRYARHFFRSGRTHRNPIPS
jgi:hypothetical protein